VPYLPHAIVPIFLRHLVKCGAAGCGRVGVVTGKMRGKSAGVTVQGWVICGLEKCGLAAEYEAL